MVTSDCYCFKWKDKLAKNQEKIILVCLNRSDTLTQNKVASIYNMSACPQLLTHYTLKSV